jgi:hypothetical protein
LDVCKEKGYKVFTTIAYSILFLTDTIAKGPMSKELP